MKITRSTVKSFIKKNASTLHIKQVSTFDGMTDCVMPTGDVGFRKVVLGTSDRNPEYTLGIPGAWFVGNSRDYFTAYAKDGWKGIEVYNSCGSFILAVPMTLTEALETEEKQAATV